MSFEFLKVENQFLETALQTLPPNLFRNYFFYKNSLDPNKPLRGKSISKSSLKRVLKSKLRGFIKKPS
jgi:hypothetical protein